jgi:KaiC/GvpD/RAD55 family RecA-like ATPase
MLKNDTKIKIVYDTENSIVFNDYFDLILNKNISFHDTKFDKTLQTPDGKTSIMWGSATKLEQYEFIRYAEGLKTIPGKPDDNYPVYTGGLQLPKKDKSSGSGNIVIMGNPGAGKSTLAFQMAAACASKINEGIAIYYSLEVAPKEMISNMSYDMVDSNENHQNIMKPWFYLPENEDDEMSSDNLCKRLRNVLLGDAKKEDQKEDQKVEPQILFPSMTPRGLRGSEDDHKLFADRYAELKLMTKAIKKYNDDAVKSDEPIIKIVVIDSINAFGDSPLTREELYRLFDLFRQYEILGVFTLEANEIKSENKNQLTSETAKYMSDVVISLDKGIYNDYTCMYIEVEKSRYVTQVIGKHPYKIAGLSPGNPLNLRKHLEITPSLHYRIFASETKSADQSQTDSNSNPKDEKINQNENKDKGENDNLFGIKQFNDVLPNHFMKRRMNIPQIITITGSSGIYKSDIAFNALLYGMLKENPSESENGLIIRMNDRSLFSTNGMRLSVQTLEKMMKLNRDPISKEPKLIKPIEIKGSEITLYESNISDKISHSEHKYSSKGWSLKKDGQPQLIEVAFKSGALLPEEFIEEVCRIIKKFKIKRVAFTDIKAIGVSYPFLINSKTSGSIFLSAFIHIMRNYGVHVIMSCSSSGYDQSDNELHKACILSDAVISMERNRKSNKINLEGEGTITSNNRIRIEIATDDQIKEALTGIEEPGDANPGDKQTVDEKSSLIKEYYFNFVQTDSQNQIKSYNTNPLSPFACNQEDVITKEA